MHFDIVSWFPLSVSFFFSSLLMFPIDYLVTCILCMIFFEQCSVVLVLCIVLFQIHLLSVLILLVFRILTLIACIVLTQVHIHVISSAYSTIRLWLFLSTFFGTMAQHNAVQHGYGLLRSISGFEEVRVSYACMA